MKLSVSPSRDHFVTENGSALFCLADTVWAAFSNARLEDWAYYLDVRREQNFNALQISVLPISHDTSENTVGLLPFQTRADGSWDFHHINPDYFQRAEQMLDMAVQRGFQICLVLLWGNYTPGNWMSKLASSRLMPFEAVAPYVRYVARTFSRMSPLYFVSGDINFESDAGHRYYLEAMSVLKAEDPGALAAMHLASGLDEMPKVLEEADELDFYVYQSGHNGVDQTVTYRMPEVLMTKKIQRPILNAEPCYEGHGNNLATGRFNAFDVRNAFWTSVLSGGKAGFTYGGHGIWSWHATGALFHNEANSRTPFDWRTAIRLRGADDVGFSRWIFERYGFFRLQPAQSRLLTINPQIRAAANDDLSIFAVYVPYASEISVDFDLTDYDIVGIELDSRSLKRPTLQCGPTASTIGMLQANQDVLLIGTR